jgi:hypothetical protein
VKLIFCSQCQDVFRLFDEPRSCKCGQCSGRYVDARNAEVTGDPAMLGFDNASFVRALRREPDNGPGARFAAFVIARDCLTIARERKE